MHNNNVLSSDHSFLLALWLHHSYLDNIIVHAPLNNIIIWVDTACSISLKHNIIIHYYYYIHLLIQWSICLIHATAVPFKSDMIQTWTIQIFITIIIRIPIKQRTTKTTDVGIHNNNIIIIPQNIIIILTMAIAKKEHILHSSSEPMFDLMDYIA